MGELPEPPWPRPKSEGTYEPPPKPKPPPIPACSPEDRATLPTAERGSGAEVEKVTRETIEMMREHCNDAARERSRLFRQLMLEWHPDKRPEEERELSTAVCQWLFGPAKCFVGGAQLP